MDECEHNEPNVTLLDLTNDENDVDDETMSGIQITHMQTKYMCRIMIKNNNIVREENFK